MRKSATPKITNLLSVELRNEDADQIMFKQCCIVRLVYQSKLKMLTTTLPKNKLTCQFLS